MPRTAWPSVGLLGLVLAVAPGCLSCRFVMYLGSDEMDAGDLMLTSAHNLMNMATKPALEHTPGAKLSSRWNHTQFALRNVDENLDGWGVAWYVDGSAYPRRVRSAEPIVSGHRPHRDLVHLIRGTGHLIPYMATNNSCVSDVMPFGRFGRLRSKAILGHVRAASTGKLDIRNSHPFVYNTLAWVHNGAIGDFDAIKDRIAASLDPNIQALVAGETDSEYGGALFVDKLKGFPLGSYTVEQLRTAMRTTLRYITETNAEFGDSNSLNFGVTDGNSLVAARYRSNPLEDPPTLYYKVLEAGIIVASEPLDTDPRRLLDWTLLGKDRLLSYSPSTGLLVDCVDPATCDDDMPAALSLADGSVRVASSR